MTTALVLFGIAAVGGLVMVTMVLRGAPRPPLALALVHGALAAAGLVALILVVVGPGAPSMAKIALVIFLVAALGGFYLIAQHLQTKPLPVPAVLIHAAVAVVAFLILLATVLKVA
jgi:hypothetical protein